MVSHSVFCYGYLMTLKICVLGVELIAQETLEILALKHVSYSDSMISARDIVEKKV